MRDGGFGPSGQSLDGANLSVNRTWFDFTTGQVDTGDGIYLPEISFSEENTPIFNFNNIVEAGLVEYYDPLVAIGYDYMIGEGNPLFASFILPEIGDDLFELHLWNGSEFVFEADVAALDEYSFGGSGVDRFRILGIETSAGLDPDDTTAFVTGLSFAANGQFTGTMTPISVFVDDPNPVPLPATLPMLLLGVAGLRFARRRTKKNCALLRT